MVAPGLSLHLSLGSDQPAQQMHGKHPANDDISREQMLFEECVSRELVDDEQV